MREKLRQLWPIVKGWAGHGSTGLVFGYQVLAKDLGRPELWQRSLQHPQAGSLSPACYYLPRPRLFRSLLAASPAPARLKAALARVLRAYYIGHSASMCPARRGRWSACVADP